MNTLSFFHPYQLNTSQTWVSFTMWHKNLVKIENHKIFQLEYWKFFDTTRHAGLTISGTNWHAGRTCIDAKIRWIPCVKVWPKFMFQTRFLNYCDIWISVTLCRMDCSVSLRRIHVQPACHAVSKFFEYSNRNILWFSILTKSLCHFVTTPMSVNVFNWYGWENDKVFTSTLTNFCYKIGVLLYWYDLF